MDASGNPVGEPAWTDTDDVTNTLDRLTPDPRATLDKIADRSSYVVSAIAQFRMHPINTGNVPLQNFTITDTLPPQLEVTRITVGRYVNYNGLVTIRYRASDNPAVWIGWTGSPFDDNNQTLDVSALGLPAGVYITALQWNYGTAQLGFQPASPGERPRIAAVQQVEPGWNQQHVALPHRPASRLLHAQSEQ